MGYVGLLHFIVVWIVMWYKIPADSKQLTYLIHTYVFCFFFFQDNFYQKKSVRSALQKSKRICYPVSRKLSRGIIGYLGPLIQSQLIRKGSDARKDWRKKEKRVAENKMVGWHHWLNLSKLWETVKDREAWCAAVHRYNLATEQLLDKNNFRKNFQHEILTVSKSMKNN